MPEMTADEILGVVTGIKEKPLAMPEAAPAAPAPQAPASDASSILSIVTKTKPDTAAQVNDLSRRTGIDKPVVERNLDTVKAQQTAVEGAALLDNPANPSTKAWMANPDNAAVAHDAIPKLTAAEYTWNKARSLVGIGIVDSFLGQTISGIGTLYGAMRELGMWTPIPEDKRGVWWLDPQRVFQRPGDMISAIGQEIAPPPESQDFVDQVAGGVGQVAGQITLALLTGGLSQIKNATTAVEAASAGVNSLTNLVSLLAQGSEQIRKDMIESTGHGPETALDNLAILGGAGVTSLTNMWGLHNLLDSIPATFKTRIGRILAGASSEAAQEITEQVGQNLIALLTYDKNRSLVDQVEPSGEVGGVVGAIVAAALPGKHHHQRKPAADIPLPTAAERDAMDAATAKDFSANLDKMRQEIMSSPLTQRDLPTAADHIATVMQDTGTKEVYVAAEAVQEFAQGKPEVLQNLQVDETTIADAAARGGDIAVPVHAFAEHVLMDDAAYAALSEHVRPTRDAMTLAEAKDIEELKTAANEQQVAEAGKVSRDTNPIVLGGEIDAKQAASAAEDEIGLQALFATAADAGMNPSTYKEYLLKVAQAAEGVKNRIALRMLEQARRSNEETWKNELDAVTQEVTDSVNKRPVYAAIDATQSERMDRNAVLASLPFPEIQLTLLPKNSEGRNLYSGVRVSGDIHPDVLAKRHGFKDATDMLMAMMNAEPRQDVIKKEADQIMADRHGDLHQAGEGIRAAIEELHKDPTAEVLATELNALREARKAKRVSAKVVRQIAQDRLRNELVDNIGPSMFFRLERKLGQLAGKLLKKGDRAGAEKAKFQQLLNFQYARESYKIENDIQKMVGFFKSYQSERVKHPNVDSEYVDQIKALLAGYDFGPKPANNELQTAILEFIKRAAARDGAIFVDPTKVLSNQMNYRDMTLGQLERLYGLVKNLEAQGQNAKVFTIANQENEWFDVKRQLVASAAALPERKSMVRQRTEQNPGDWETIKGLVAWADAGVRKVEFLLQKLDGGKLTGLWHKTIFQRIADAQTDRFDTEKAILAPLEKSLRTASAEVRAHIRSKVFVPELGRTYRISDIMMMALNAGTDSNLTKMIEGSKADNKAPQLSELGVEAALKHLRPEELKWVQSVWDAFDKMYPRVEAIHKKEFGIAPVRVQGRNFQVNGVEMRGSYYPIQYDPRRTHAVTEIDPTDALEAMQSQHTQSNVFSGMTKERTGYSAPVLLDMSHLMRGLQSTIHYITHYEAVRDINRILQDGDVKSTIRNKLGKEYYDEFKNWLVAVATNGNDGIRVKFWDDMLEMFRANTTFALLAGSFTAGVSQTLGTSTSVAVLGRNPDGSFSSREGAKWMAVGMESYLNNPNQITKMAKRLSGEIRHRMESIDRESAEGFRRLSGKTSVLGKALQAERKATMLAISGMQFFTVDIPTWNGAFQKAISLNMTEKEAVNYADSVLRMSQATGHVKDLSALQRKKGAWRILTMFASYTMVLYNLQAQTGSDTGIDTKGWPKLKNAPSAAARLAWLTVLPAVASGLLHADLPKDEDPETIGLWVSQKATAYALSAIPVVGNITSNLLEGYEPTLSPVAQLGKNLYAALTDMQKVVNGEKEMDEKSWKKLVLAIGQLTGVGGTFQIGRALSAAGAEEDTELYDWLNGYHKPK